MGSLDPKPYREKLRELYDYVKENMPANIREAHEMEMNAVDAEEDPETALELERAALAAAIAEADVILGDASSRGNELTETLQQYCVKVQALMFTQSAWEFIDQFEDATIALEGMLLSANTSDVTEALRFFVKARHFRLPCAVTGMKRALALMWSSEQTIREEVLKAFVDVFIAEPGTDGTVLLPENTIAKNLMVLVGQASVSELASVEEAIHRLVKDERIPVDVFLILWSIASKGKGDARASALCLLSMGAGADSKIVDSKSRLKLLLDAGLGDYMQENNDWSLAGAAATALQRIERARVDPSDAKYLVLERIMEELCAVARGDKCDDNNKEDTLQWFPAAEQAIKALFAICPAPERACREIILGMHASTLHEDHTSVHSLRLARFFHVLGQIALNLLVYTEFLTSNVRRANASKALKRQEEADQAKARKQQRASSGSNEEEEEDAIEAELGVAAQVEAETERNMADIAEKEILGRGLISIFSPLLLRVVANDGGVFNSEILKQASMLALCKFMCVSSSFCDKHLPLLFTALANAPPEDTTMRANTVIALGDLAFRFPNELEPYTPRVYACLRDPSTKVRRHTLMVLTHLILNDMVKVKGQVCEIALCLRDEDPRIRDMSRLLFFELSKRSNNPIYNLLPDIISQLSQLSLPKEEFRGIMSFLLGYIKKERQNEMLAEKLCQRFPKCTTISQKADLGYCLAQLKISEKGVKLLCDNFKLYKDALFDEDVKKNFLSIVTKAKKSLTKPESRQLVEEWETRLNESSEAGAEDQEAGEKAAQARARAGKKNTRKQQQRRKSRKSSMADDNDDDEEESEEDRDKSDDDDDDDDDGPAATDKENTQTVMGKTPTKSAAKSHRPTRRTRRRNVAAVSDGEHSE